VILTPSLGVIVEEAIDPSKATSYFELFFEFDASPLMPGLFLYNQIPHQMQTTIDRVPPLDGSTHVPPTSAPTPLYDAPVGGNLIAQIIASSHTVPEPSTALLLALGLAQLPQFRRKLRVYRGSGSRKSADLRDWGPEVGV
jgi:hypothetical protein